MIKRICALIILISLSLHCASRLGILSYIYQQRHVIAFSAGLIDEVPIAVCGSDYDYGRGLKIDVSHDAMPELANAQEINLFVMDQFKLNNPIKSQLRDLGHHLIDNQYRFRPIFSIFHPPALYFA